MNDKNYMTDLLTCSKTLCTLLLHGTIESSTPLVNSMMNKSLFDALSIQNSIYKEMENKGWYQVDCAPQMKIENTANTISCN